ncbi:MAG: CDP-glucose 4,6-dehydratase [Alphaproteobacteria bacterium]|nr:MAG: CDP-glucose 4,6-dehydratase [Alphaproteobacteria bacterium]
MFKDIYRRRRVLVTGHAGFKGSWLCMWLQQLGAEVTGYSLEGTVTEPNHYGLLDMSGIDDRRGDIRDYAALKRVVDEVKPELVFHMAAQPLVGLSYLQPLDTFATNVMGAANILQACRGVESLKGVVNITSDKCYENTGKDGGYVETDAMGGHDPYSASKGCAELVAASFARAFDDLAPVASVRAGNVIGGGDWARDRLIPDVVKAKTESRELVIRRPGAVRPWQHVLEPLSGYLLVGQRMLEGAAVAGGWNFGPNPESVLTVQTVLEKLKLDMDFAYRAPEVEDGYHEAAVLTLNSDKATEKLGWEPIWDAETMLRKTGQWYEAFVQRGEVTSLQQLETYVADAAVKGQPWAS